MDAALAVFSELGVDASTIEAITERADLGKGTFYRHFPDKDSLLLALIDRAVGKLLDAIRRAVGSPQNLAEALDGLVRGHMNFFQSSRQEYVLLFQGRMLLKLERETGELEGPYRRYLEALENLVRPFIGAPVDSLKMRRSACAIAGFVSGFLSFAMIAVEPDSIDRHLAPVRRAFVDSLIAFMGRS